MCTTLIATKGVEAIQSGTSTLTWTSILPDGIVREYKITLSIVYPLG